MTFQEIVAQREEERIKEVLDAMNIFEVLRLIRLSPDDAFCAINIKWDKMVIKRRKRNERKAKILKFFSK